MVKIDQLTSEHLCRIASIQRRIRRWWKKRPLKTYCLNAVFSENLCFFLFVFAFYSVSAMVFWYDTQQKNLITTFNMRIRSDVKEINESLLLGNETTDKRRRSVSVWGVLSEDIHHKLNKYVNDWFIISSFIFHIACRSRVRFQSGKIWIDINFQLGALFWILAVFHIFFFFFKKRFLWVLNEHSFGYGSNWKQILN